MSKYTNEDLVRDWFAGNDVSVVEMGGIGIGYECGIYETAVSLLRYITNNPFDWDTYESLSGSKRSDFFDAYRDIADKDEEVAKALNNGGGITGAMYHAAWNVATVFDKHGYEVGIAKAPADRIVRINRGKLPFN